MVARAAALLLAGAVGGRAELEVTCELALRDALLLESLPAVVTLSNRSPFPMEAGKDYSLFFVVTDADGTRLRARPGAAPDIPPAVAPGDTVVFTNDLTALFAINRAGSYAVSAEVAEGALRRATPRAFVDVQSPVSIVTATGRAPDGSPRAYSLCTLSRQGRTTLFLRIEDPGAGLSYAVLDLGRYIPMRLPELKADARGFVHVLHMAAPTRFLHSVFDPQGVLVAQQVHAGEGSAIRLEPDADMGFRVTGGGAAASSDKPVLELPFRSL